MQHKVNILYQSVCCKLVLIRSCEIQPKTSLVEPYDPARFLEFRPTQLVSTLNMHHNTNNRNHFIIVTNITINSVISLISGNRN